MSKYTTEELRGMAREALQARDGDDARYLQLVMSISLMAFMNANEVERRIEGLAQ